MGGRDAVIVPTADVTKSEDVQKYVRETVEAFGIPGRSFWRGDRRQRAGV